jgi:cytochrome c-type biogenesis protein CcmH
VIQRVLIIACAMSMIVGAALAVEPDEILRDPALEARARAISQNLRCLVCQNQSIDDSNAPLARDLRVIVRERLADGDSDDAVIAFVTARYGDYVLLKPPVKPATYLLWAAPILVLIGGGGMIAMAVRRRRKVAAAAAAPAALSADERKRVASLLDDDGR